ncbi:MAG: hypothetical protein JW768_01535 [Chitinispirillaceae bacterium]|nr:hypothetical protein [Chitinispirillaceae bacterium]
MIHSIESETMVPAAVLRVLQILFYCVVCAAAAVRPPMSLGAAVLVASAGDSSVRSGPSAAGGCAEEKARTIDGSKQHVYDRIRALSVRRGPLVKNRSVNYYAYPLKGRYYEKDFDSAASSMRALLSRYGTVRFASLQELVPLLSRKSETTMHRGYLILPVEIRSSRKEKRAVVQSFVNLDNEGNFVPADESRTITSTGVETRIRFVAVDLDDLTIVFDLWLKGRAGSGDFGEEGFPDRGKSKSRRLRDQSLRSVMYIVEKVKGEIKRQFK